MKWTLIFILLSLPAFAANHYVRASGDVTFNGNGTTWAAAASNGAAGAFKGFPASTAYTRGDTYYFAGGSYGDFTFNTTNSGTTRITCQKATVADHGGMATGWSDSYGTTQAVFTLVSINKDYFTFDGATGGGPGSWTSGFGVFVDTSWQTAATAYPAVFLGEVTQDDTTSIIVKHFEVLGNGGDGTSSSGQTNDGVASWGSIDTTISYAYIHDMGRCICIFLPSTNLIWEYTYTGPYEYTGAEHSEIASTNGDNLTFRYNIFADCIGTGGLMFNGANAKIYGNIFFHSVSNTSWAYAGNGLIGSKDSGEPITTAVIYNNTFYNPYADDASGGPQIFGFYMNSGSLAKNNLYYGHIPASPGFTECTHDYNQYTSLTGGSAPTETNRTITSGNPFVNAESLDFRLTANTTAGTDVGSPYNVDMLGNTRTTWTRGAIEYVSSGAATGSMSGGASLLGPASIK